MKKVKVLLCLLALLIAELSFVGYVEAKYASSHDVTTKLVVTFEANEYQLTLDANGGEFAKPEDGSKVVDYKGTYGELPTPTREGYTFDGWYTDKTGGARIGATDTVEITEDTTIYAHWTANTYTIKYDANSGTGEMADTPATYDADVTLSANTFEKTGYTFDGWNTAADGTGTAYENQAVVKNLTAEDKGTVTLYAQWEANQYVVIFDPNKGSGTMENQTFTYDEAKSLSKNLFTRTGYTFDGWNTKADGTGISYADEASVLNLVAGGNTTLYAQWKANEYTIEYDKNADNAIGTMGSTKAAYDQAVTLSANAFTRPGYLFDGWNTKADGSGTSYVDKGSVENLATSGTATLYAQWKANTYTVKYDANGGEGTMEDQIFTFDVEDFLRVNTFTREGYNFTGWGLSASGGVAYTEKQFVENLTTNTQITLFAIWSADSDIVVTFDTCYAGVTVDPPTMFVTYDSPYGDMPVPAIEGYSFKGWYTAAEGGTQVTAETKVTNTENHTLYAQWIVPNIDLLLMFDGSGTNNFTTFAKHDYTFGEAVTYTGQTWRGKWESFSIGMHNLTVGGTYRLTFDAAFSDRTCIRDEGNTYPIGCKVDDHQHYAESESTEEYTWVPTDTNKSVKGFTIEFEATKSSMYWLWELSKIRNPGEEYGKWQPGVENFEESYFDLTLSNVSLTLVEPDIEFEKTTALTESGKGAFSRKSSTDNSVKFTYTGTSGLYEKGRIPITNLIPGETYTVDFDLTTNAHGGVGTYHFGFLVGSDGTLVNENNFNGATRVWNGDSFITGSGERSVSGQFSFEATAKTMYWMLDMQCVGNDVNYTYNIKADITRNPSATATTLSLRQEETHDIELIWDGIDDSNMDAWYPVDEQYPVSGDSYEMAFEPMEGCAMADTITVTIDGVVYAVRTNGQAAAGAPSYDPERNVLTIPAKLLTSGTRTVAITASAVETAGGNTQQSETSTPKTLAAKMLEAGSLQELYGLLSGSEAETLTAAELSQVRMYAETIYAEAVLTEEEVAAYDLVSDRLKELGSLLADNGGTQSGATQSTQQSAPAQTTPTPEPTTPVVTPEPTEPVIVSKTLKDRLLETQSLQALYNLLVSDEAGTLTTAELGQARMHAEVIYAEAAPTEEVTTYYALVSDRLNELVSQQ